MAKEISHSEFGLKNFWQMFQNLILKNCLKQRKLVWNKQMKKQELVGGFMLKFCKSTEFSLDQITIAEICS